MKKVDIRTIEMEISRIEDDDVREALYAILELLKQHDRDILHFWTYAEGVR